MELQNGIEKTYFEANDGKIICITKDTRKWDIYVLFKSGVPIYAGQSTNLKSRLTAHRYTTGEFDSYMVVNTVYTEEQARIAEHTIIGYLKVLHPELKNKYSLKFSGKIIKL